MADWSLPENRTRFWAVTFLTVIRIPVGIGFIVLMLLSDSLNWQTAAIALGLLACVEITDVLDGYLSRRLEVQSEWGAMLDPYSDSVARLLIYFGLSQADLIWFWVPLVMAVRDVTVAYCRIMISRTGGSVAARVSGKIKAVVQGIAAFAAVIGAMLLPEQIDVSRVALSLLVITVTLWSIGQYAESAIASTKTGHSEE